MSAAIISIGTAVPDFRYRQAEIKETVRHMFGPRYTGLDRLLTIFEHSGIETRHFCVPLDWFLSPRSVDEKHQLFVKHAVKLAEQAVNRCLGQAGIAAEAVDHIFLVTTTGTATPSIDAHLINRIPFRTNVKRTPIWGLGCAGGAAGLSRASEYVEAFPDQMCLLVSVELCSLTFLRNDVSKSNIVATSLFADGAAAVLVAGEASSFPVKANQAPCVIATQSTIWRNTLDIMGWNVVNDGLQVVFSKDIPSFVKSTMRENVGSLLRLKGLSDDELHRYLLHPGGMKVLDAYEAAFDLPPVKLDVSRSVLRSYGNMSSSTILFVMEEALRSGPPFTPGQYGLAGSLGPGFSSELLLLQF